MYINNLKSNQKYQYIYIYMLFNTKKNSLKPHIPETTKNQAKNNKLLLYTYYLLSKKNLKRKE